MKRYSVVIEVDDDFEPGCCYYCPLSYEQNYDDDGYIECDICCSMGCFYENCPLVEYGGK